ncbi:hypothetical protein C7E12_19710, partial [Stenotrophomonas maltophilia]
YIVRTDAAKTALAFVALDASGERSFSFYRPPAADLLFRDSDFQAACFDMFGDFLADSLVEHGVGTDYIVRTDAAKTALAFVALDASGERSFSFYRPPAA